MAEGGVVDASTGGHTVGRMRLTIVITSTQRRGAEVFASQLADSLPGRGWHVDLVALADRTPGVEAGVPALALSDVAPADLGRLEPAVVGALRRRVIEGHPSVVLANGSSTLQYCIAATRTIRHRPRLVYASVGEPLYWAADRRRRLTYRLMLSMVDHVISLSTPTAAQLTDALGVPPDKLLVLPTGVPSRFSELRSHRREGPLHILFAGSLSDEKDPLAALEVFRVVRAAVPAELRFAGSGPLASRLAQAVAAADVVDDVVMSGVVPDMAPVLEWADALLLTSRTEGLPGVALEAAAAGVPVVGFDVGGVAEAVVNGVTGEIVPAGDIEAAAAALVRFAQDEELRGAASEAGRRLVRDRFTMAHAIDRYDRALQTVIEERGSR